MTWPVAARESDDEVLVKVIDFGLVVSDSAERQGSVSVPQNLPDRCSVRITSEPRACRRLQGPPGHSANNSSALLEDAIYIEKGSIVIHLRRTPKRKTLSRFFEQSELQRG